MDFELEAALLAIDLGIEAPASHKVIADELRRAFDEGVRRMKTHIAVSEYLTLDQQRKLIEF